MSHARTWLRSLLAAAAIHLVVGAGLYCLLHTNPPPPPPVKIESASGLIPYDIDLQNTAAAQVSPVAEPLVPGPKLHPPSIPQPPVMAPQLGSAATSPVAEPVGAADPSASEGPSAGPFGQPSSPAGSPSPPKLTGAGGGGSHPAGPVGVVGPGPDHDRLVAQALARIRAERHYPELARRRGIEGTVHIAFVVGADGHPRNLTIRQAVDPLLEEAAREAVLRAAPLPPLGPAELDLDFHLED